MQGVTHRGSRDDGEVIGNVVGGRVYTADNGSERDSFFVNVWKSVNRGYSIPWVRRSVTLSFSSCFRQLVGSHFRASLASLRRNLCDNPLSLGQHCTSPCQTVI